MTIPITPGFIVNMGATLTFAGFVTGIIYFAALFARPLGSLLGDSFNKKWLLMGTTAITGVSILLYAFVPGVFWLLPNRILHGIFFSLSGTFSFALGTYYIPANRMGEGVGFLGVGQVLGRAIGPYAGIYLADNYSHELCFIVGGCILIAAGIAIVVIRYDQADSRPRGAAGLLPSKPISFNDLVAVKLLPNALFGGLLILGTGISNSYLVMLGIERNISNIGLFFIVNSLILLLSRPYLGKLADRRGVISAIIPGFAFTTLALATIAISGSIWTILIAAFFLALGGGALTAIQADCLNMLSPGQKTLATATYLVGLDIGVGFGQILGGISIEHLGFSATFAFSALLTFIGLVLYMLYKSKRL